MLLEAYYKCRISLHMSVTNMDESLIHLFILIREGLSLATRFREEWVQFDLVIHRDPQQT